MKIFFITLLLLTVGCTNKNSITQSKIVAPIIDSNNNFDIYWDTYVQDNYRHLENNKDSVVSIYFKNYSEYSNNVLNQIQNKDSLITLFQSFDKKSPYRITNTKITENDRYFYLKKNSDEKEYNVYYKDGYKGKETLLYSINSFKPEDDLNYKINYLEPSWDGNYVAIAISDSGKEVSDIIIVDLVQNKVLPQVIESAWPDSFLGISWLPDNSGFMFLHFPNATIPNKNIKEDTQTVLYKLGAPSDKLKVIINKHEHSNLVMPNDSYPIATIRNQKDKFLVAYAATVEPYWNAYYTPISSLDDDKIVWKPLYTQDDQVLNNKGIFQNDSYIYVSTKQSDQGGLYQVSADTNFNFTSPETLVELSENEVFNDFRITSTGIYYSTLKNGVKASMYKYTKEDKVQKIKLPSSAGDISFRNKNGQSPDLWVTLSGWNSRSKRYRYNDKNKTFDFEPLSYYVDYPEFEDFIIEEIEVISHDGVMVPLSLIYKKGTNKNGTNPVFMTAYGAYGDSFPPSFSSIYMSWVYKGGILAIAHVRGGGEKGDSWYKGGLKKTKPNSWKDFIACANYLIDKKYSSKGKIVANGDSAGGITASRAIIEAPDLFGALVSQSGVLNPIRSEFSGGGSNVKEYGTVKDSLEFKYLLEMDAFQQIKEKRKYPAVFLITGVNDPRVKFWISGKFVAKYNVLNTSNAPALHKINYDEGHNSNSIDQVYDDWADIFAFSLWQTGHPDYQLKE